MTETLFPTLAAAAVSIAAIHALAPDHWLPFAALARARGWSVARTAAVTSLCSAGHVGFTALLGVAGLWIGGDLVQASGARLEQAAGALLVLFGLLYATWSLRRAAGRRLHGGHHGWRHSHEHEHGHAHLHAWGGAHIHDPSRLAVGTLFVVFSIDVCVALLPLMLVAAPLGAARAAAVVVLYGATTTAVMITLSLAARAGVALLTLSWAQRHGDVLAGTTIVAVGVVAMVLGF